MTGSSVRTLSVIVVSATILRVASPLLGTAQPQLLAETITSCAEDLQIPRHGPPGGVGDKVGPLIVKVVPDKTGHPTSVAIKGGSEAAAIFVKSWISESTFASRCRKAASSSDLVHHRGSTLVRELRVFFCLQFGVD